MTCGHPERHSLVLSHIYQANLTGNVNITSKFTSYFNSTHMTQTDMLPEDVPLIFLTSLVCLQHNIKALKKTRNKSKSRFLSPSVFMVACMDS